MPHAGAPGVAVDAAALMATPLSLAVNAPPAAVAAAGGQQSGAATPSLAGSGGGGADVAQLAALVGSALGGPSGAGAPPVPV